MGSLDFKREELLKIRSVIEVMKQDGIDYETFRTFGDLIIPKDDMGVPLIENKINESGMGRKVLSFYPDGNSILGVYSHLEEWCKLNSEDFEVTDKDKLDLYLKLFALSHEVVHANQFLYGTGAKSTGIVEVDKSYKEVIGLLEKDDYILPRPIKRTRKMLSLLLYKLKQNYYCLERNANVEAFFFVAMLAKEFDDLDIYDSFMETGRMMMQLGYLHDNKGSIHETFKKLLMMDKYRRIFDCVSRLDVLDDYTRVLYGLEVREEVRKDVLKLRF